MQHLKQCIQTGQRLIPVLLFSLLAFSGMAQQGRIRFNVLPADAIIRVGEVRVPGRMQVTAVDTGWQAVHIWAPKMNLHTDTIHIPPGRIISYSKGLTYCKAYRQYRSDLSRYKLKTFALRCTGPVLAVPIALAVLTGVRRVNGHDQELIDRKNAVKAAAREYEAAFTLSDLGVTASIYQSQVDQYDALLKKRNATYRNTVITAAAGTTLVALLTWQGRKKASKLVKPNYEEKPLLSVIQIQVNPFAHESYLYVAYRF